MPKGPRIEPVLVRCGALIRWRLGRWDGVVEHAFPFGVSRLKALHFSYLFVRGKKGGYTGESIATTAVRLLSANLVSISSSIEKPLKEFFLEPVPHEYSIITRYTHVIESYARDLSCTCTSRMVVVREAKSGSC